MSGIEDSNKAYNDDQSAVADVLNNGGLNVNITVGITAVEVRVGANKLAGRKSILIQPLANTVYLGFSNAVTVTNGIRLSSGMIFILPIGESTAVWLIANGADKDVRIAEVA